MLIELFVGNKMKIVHLCLANFYIEGFGYQENLLPKFHKQMGYEVEVITSLFTFDENGKGCFLKKGGTYINEHGIKITRLEYKNKRLSKILRQYVGTYEAICESNPDIIFIHGCQFLDIKYVIKYVKRYPHVKVYVDNHADFSNSARNYLSNYILHRIIWRYCAHLIEPYTSKFYGVLPARVDFLKDVYNIPQEKIELLVMGADDEEVEKAKDENVRKLIRSKYNIKQNDFLIVTGGKIDNAKKQTLLLMEAIKRIKNENVKLLIFGSVINDLKDKFNSLVDGEKVQYIGWVHSSDSYKYFAAADLVVFPGRHSVFWEQVVGLGIPMVVKYWRGTTHVDLGGNCKFLYNDSADEIYEVLLSLINNKNEIFKMKEVAETKGMKYFSYKNIALKAIQKT